MNGSLCLVVAMLFSLEITYTKVLLPQWKKKQDKKRDFIPEGSQTTNIVSCTILRDETTVQKRQNGFPSVFQ